jgi:hypothetical protein
MLTKAAECLAEHCPLLCWQTGDKNRQVVLRTVATPLCCNPPQLHPPPSSLLPPQSGLESKKLKDFKAALADGAGDFPELVTPPTSPRPPPRPPPRQPHSHINIRILPSPPYPTCSLGPLAFLLALCHYVLKLLSSFYLVPFPIVHNSIYEYSC